MVHFDPKQPICLAGDASAYGIGAVISRKFRDGTEKPIAFASRSLSAAEKNYSQLEREAACLVFGIKKFHQYIYGRKFILITDHKPLTAILGPKKGIPTLAAARLQRWALLLSAYNYDIQFKPTAAHGNADGLSRLPLSVVTEKKPMDDVAVFNLAQIGSCPIVVSEIRWAKHSDSVLSNVLNFTLQGWPDNVSSKLIPFKNRATELTVESDCLLWGGHRVVISSELQGEVLKELYDTHPGICPHEGFSQKLCVVATARQRNRNLGKKL